MFIIELNPGTLTYLTKLMDAPGVTVRSEDVMSHAQIRQQLANPTESSKLVEQLKQQGVQEYLSKQVRPADPGAGGPEGGAPVVPLNR
jgi:hypothetical protein